MYVGAAPVWSAKLTCWAGEEFLAAHTKSPHRIPNGGNKYIISQIEKKKGKKKRKKNLETWLAGYTYFSQLAAHGNPPRLADQLLIKGRSSYFSIGTPS